MSLVARHLEQAGIPCVVVGAARDIVEHCGVARLLFSDLPLGNPCGLPWDEAMQREVAEGALALLENATEPRTTAVTRFRFGDGEGWKSAYMHIDDSERDTLARSGERRRAAQESARREGHTRTD